MGEEKIIFLTVWIILGNVLATLSDTTTEFGKSNF